MIFEDIHMPREATMRTNIDIDEALMKEAMRATGLTTKKATVEEALKAVILTDQRRKALDSLYGIGWQGDLDDTRTDDPVELLP